MGVSSGIDLIAGVLRNAPSQDVDGDLTAASKPAPAAAASPGAGEEKFGDMIRTAIADKAQAADYTSTDLVRVERAKKEDGEEMLQRLLLNSVVETILPKDVTSFTGSGTAGNVWRSMLAEHIANELSQSMDLRLLDGRQLGKQNSSQHAGDSGKEIPAAIAERKLDV